jgi:hypothetical protein
MNEETGGPAFPVPGLHENNDYDGMTLRDYFAAKAMQGFATDGAQTWRDGVAGMAKSAYEWADAMFEARSKS